MQKLKQGDEIIVIIGKDKGKLGKVTKIDGQKVLVEGLNLVKKHQKGNPNLGVSGGIVEKSMPLDISNIALYNPKTRKADRVGFKFLEDGNKVRYFKSNNEIIA
jgi:large subunit ribosomal protein L24